MVLRNSRTSLRRWLIAGFSVPVFGVSSGCADISTLEKGDKNNPWEITISFSDAEACEIQSVTAESNSCGLPDEDICIERGKFLEWKTDPSGIDFDIFFGPTEEGAIKGNNGKAKSKINDFAPPGMYKYSILRRDCDPEEYLLDPRVRVD
ncbi:MAG: hypothetical protein OEW68_00730 [Gammaproteobacteria bacterium]|nr:hypothetical protein [Gammaproteobacteria bacterium]MDH4313349.1 hypothetical protein [Gammaproteobacteria bacterium]MDH5214006.1 hypothetical protein [Gammaproteobacteria bacterium]